jgi:hypothetical protein
MQVRAYGFLLGLLEGGDVRGVLEGRDGIFPVLLRDLKGIELMREYRRPRSVAVPAAAEARDRSAVCL